MQRAKALSSIFNGVSEKYTFFKGVQCANADFSMTVMLSGSFTDFKRIHPSKPPSRIRVTLIPLYSEGISISREALEMSYGDLALMPYVPSSSKTYSNSKNEF